MLTILQSKKGLRQEGGHQNYEMNSVKLVILNDKVRLHMWQSSVVSFLQEFITVMCDFENKLKPSIVMSQGPICLADHP